MKKILFFISLVIILQNCREDDGIGADGIYNVDPTFEPFVQEFIAEGAKRGETIDFSESGLIVEFSDVQLPGANGLCYLGQHHIQIDKSRWFSFSEDVRGFLLFHELGHCELDRRHRNDKFGNDAWRSIMRGDPLEGLEIWIPIPYFGFRKDYFIDELFNEQINPPAWATQTFAFEEVPSSAKEVIDTITNTNRINQRYTDLTGDYEFEVDFSLASAGSTSSIKLIWGTTTNHYYLQIVPGAPAFNVSGYFIGVRQDSQDNNLFFSSNTSNINGAPINKITVRREGGFEKIFLNEEFIYHIDLQANPLSTVRMEATMPQDAIDGAFDIQQFEARRIN